MPANISIIKKSSSVHNWRWTSSLFPILCWAFFLECFTAFWGAILNYCMRYRLLESAEVSSKLNLGKKNPNNEYWAMILNFKSLIKTYLRNGTRNCCAFSLWNSSFSSKLYLIQYKFGVRQLEYGCSHVHVFLWVIMAENTISPKERLPRM